MKTLGFALLLSSSCLVVAGCAVDPSASEPVMGIETDGLRTAPVWPPRVDIPVGSKKDAICGRDDGDTHAAFAAYVASKNAKVTEHPDANVEHWKMENGELVCRYCNLDGMDISIKGTDRRIAIVDSSAKGTRIHNTYPANVRFENVYARGAALYPTTTVSPMTLGARRLDMRCGTIQVAYGGQSTFVAANDLDLSGADLTMKISGASSDVRLTGAGGVVDVTDKVTDLRADGMSNVEFAMTNATLAGTTRFNGSGWLNVTGNGLTFAGGTVTMAGAGGYLKSDGAGVTFDRAELPDTDGGFVVFPDHVWNVRFTKGSTLPVGAHVLVPDDRLVRLNLAGVHLVSREESWPTVTNLDHLVLTGGSLPAEANLAGVSLVDARLEGIDFSDVVLSKQVSGPPNGAKLVGANLQRATLGGKLVDGVDFTRADLRGATLDAIHGSATFVQAQAGTLPAHTGANDTNQRIDTSFRGALLAQSHFDDAQLQYAVFAKAVLTDVAFDGAHLDFASFSKATFFRAGTTSAGDVFNTTLAHAASMRAVDFSDADLRKVSLAKADITPMADDTNVVRRASFTNAFMCGGDLSNAKLGGANLSGLFFDVDGSVTFPDGTKGTCEGGKRAGATTAPASGIETSCPLYGQRPALAGQCSDAQWKVPGDTSDECPADTPKKRIGAPCTKGCECASTFCSAEGVCAHE